MNPGEHPMKKILLVASVAAIFTQPVLAQETTKGLAHAEALTTIPASTTTVTNYYKQNVYDPSDSKIGEIKDVLVGANVPVAVEIRRQASIASGR
jgi:hypothetical protein